MKFIFKETVMRFNTTTQMGFQKALRLSSIAIFTASVSLCATQALAAGAKSTSEARAQYETERAACLNGQSNQDRKTCLKEAGAALSEARQGHLKDRDASYDQNAVIRCNALPQADRQACERRVHGEGTTEGSVAAGGLYRELTVPDIAPQGNSTPDSNMAPSSMNQQDSTR
jgi:hypothetical protein